MNSLSNPFKNFAHDLPASVVVFLVALPLCLGISLASGAPLFSGIVAGVVGGLVVGSLSGSCVSVSGPAAGLTTIVLGAIATLGRFDYFLVAVVLAGILQVVFGFLKAGAIGNFFPSAVIKGMLAAIGFILILKQIPHALGYDRDFEGDESFMQADGENTFTEIWTAVDYITPGALLVALLSIGIILLWENTSLTKNNVLKFIPAPLVVVGAGVAVNSLLTEYAPSLAIGAEHLVSIQISTSASDFLSLLQTPDLGALSNPSVYTAAATIAVVASLETLLSIEASDKLDPFKRKTPLNQELKAQGVGNIVSGLLGGLPVTAVIVRSSANITAGARTKLSTIVHGLFLLISVIAIPYWLNLIPLAALAAILLMIGYKLAKPSIFKSIYINGRSQFIPFISTIVAILLTDLLIGISIGLAIGLYFVLKENFKKAVSITQDNNNYLLRLNRDVSFLNKAVVRDSLNQIPSNTSVLIDGGNSQFIDPDIIETIEDFVLSAPARNIAVEIKKSYAASHVFFRKNPNE
jgi:MFS superfamily sulfate permease-like transporter